MELCPYCGGFFQCINEHISNAHIEKAGEVFPHDLCSQCGLLVKNLTSHICKKTDEEVPLDLCYFCGRFVKGLNCHLRACHLATRKRKSTDKETPSSKRKQFDIILKPGFRREYPIDVTNESVQYGAVIDGLSTEMQQVLEEGRRDFGAISVLPQMSVQFVRTNEEGQEEFQTFFFVLTRLFLMLTDSIHEIVDEMTSNFKQKVEDFEQRGSNWVYQKILAAKLFISKYSPLNGSSYIPTPKQLVKKKAVINVKNSDNRCLLWALLSALHPVNKNPDRCHHYRPFQNEVNLDGVEFPVKLDSKVFKKIREQNPNLHFNVFVFFQAENGGKEEILPFSLHSDPNAENVVDLLHIGEQPEGHYVWIESFSRLLNSECNHHYKRFLCKRCFQNFNTSDSRLRHIPDCNTSVEGIKDFPHCKNCPDFDPECEACQYAATMKFRGYKQQQELPVIIVADFESYLVEQTVTGEGNTKKLQKHVPASYGYKVIVAEAYRHLSCFRDLVNYPTIIQTADNLENDLAKEFLEEVCALGDQIMGIILNTEEPLKWEAGEEELFKNATHCHICGGPFGEKIKCADHDHLTGRYRGAAHDYCNLNFNLKKSMVPILLHNYRSYDSKLILSGVGQVEEKWAKTIKVLAQNSEQFKSMTIGGLQFLDSFQHLPCSLDTLAQNLLRDCFNEERARADYPMEKGDLFFTCQKQLPWNEFIDKYISLVTARLKFPTLSEEFPEDNKFSMLLKKGVFPYSWFNEPDKLTERTLPSIEEFKNDLTQTPCSLQCYEYAQMIWNIFAMRSFQEYMQLYLKVDVLLLADVIKNYRKVSLMNYKLDPLWFITAPSLSLNAALKKTKIRLQLLTDMEMFNFIQRSIRGGLSYIATRHATTDQEHVIKYFDANNLYGYALSQSLPYGDFKWVDPATWKDFYDNGFWSALPFSRVFNHINMCPTNYFLEVDAVFPDSIHEKMRDLPMLPEQIIPPGSDSKVPKLINHVGPRSRYVLSYEMYQLAKRQGVEFPVIHRILSYSQRKWLKPYIEFNSNERVKAKDSFSKDYFKLLNNSLYGKMTEDVMKYVNYEIYTSSKIESYQSLHLSKPFLIKNETVYQRCNEHEMDNEAEVCTEFSSCVVGVERRKFRVKLNKPIYVGAKVLEISKLLMYDIWYNSIVPQFGDRAKLLATDTDSFVIQFRTPNLIADLIPIRNRFDFFNYPQSHPLFSTCNERVPGFMKDEYPNSVIREWVGLRPKCYAFKCDDLSVVKRAKGVKKDVVKRQVHFDDYLHVWREEGAVLYRTQRMIRSTNQTLYTVEQTKKALSANDDKRFICDDNVNTLPWFHKDIK